MPEKLKDALRVQMAIPAWSVFTALLAGAVIAGTMLQKLTTLAESFERAATQVSRINDQQIMNTTVIANMQVVQQSHESRIAALERSTWERK
jgi:hypothetical protein